MCAQSNQNVTRQARFAHKCVTPDAVCTYSRSELPPTRKRFRVVTDADDRWERDGILSAAALCIDAPQRSLSAPIPIEVHRPAPSQMLCTRIYANAERQRACDCTFLMYTQSDAAESEVVSFVPRTQCPFEIMACDMMSLDTHMIGTGNVAQFVCICLCKINAASASAPTTIAGEMRSSSSLLDGEENNVQHRLRIGADVFMLMWFILCKNGNVLYRGEIVLEGGVVGAGDFSHHDHHYVSGWLPRCEHILLCSRSPPWGRGGHYYNIPMHMFLSGKAGVHICSACVGVDDQKGFATFTMTHGPVYVPCSFVNQTTAVPALSDESKRVYFAGEPYSSGCFGHHTQSIACYDLRSGSYFEHTFCFSPIHVIQVVPIQSRDSLGADMLFIIQKDGTASITSVTVHGLRYVIPLVALQLSPMRAAYMTPQCAIYVADDSGVCVLHKGRNTRVSLGHIYVAPKKTFVLDISKSGESMDDLAITLFTRRDDDKMVVCRRVHLG